MADEEGTMVDNAHRDDARQHEDERKDRRPADRARGLPWPTAETDRRRLACMGWGIADALWGDGYEDDDVA